MLIRPFFSSRSESSSDTESESSSGRSGSDSDNKDRRVSSHKAKNLKDAENKPTRTIGMPFFQLLYSLTSIIWDYGDFFLSFYISLRQHAHSLNFISILYCIDNFVMVDLLLQMWKRNPPMK